MKRMAAQSGWIEFHLEGDRVRVVWPSHSAQEILDVSDIIIDGELLTLEDGKAFYDCLDRAYPGSIETVD
jgi:hypothetical protein